MLSRTSLLGKIGREYRVPVTDEFSGIEDGIAQIPGALFLHVSVAAGKLSRLIGRWREASVSENFISGIEIGEVSDFSQNHSAHAAANAGNGRNGRR